MAYQVTIKDLSQDDNATINRLLQQIEDKSRRNLVRANLYDGKHAIRRVGSVIPRQYYRLGVVLGWSAKAVDVLARRCNLDGFVWPDGDIDELGAQELWDANFFGTESSSAIISSLIHGPAFLITTKGGDREPDALIHVKDALSASGEWNVRRRGLDNLLSITSRDNDGNPDSLVLYLDGQTIIASRGLGKWAVDDDTRHKWGVPAELLPYKPRVGRPFGSSRISRTVISLHEQALRTVVRMEGNADIYSLPQLVLLGADERIFRNPDGSIKPAWQVALGRVFGIPDDDETDVQLARADVKQFQAASPEPHIAMLKQQAMLFSGETSIPLTSLGVSDMSNPTSADSYIASREDLIAEAEGATDDWSPAFRRTMARALAIANNDKGIPDEYASIDTKWRSPVYLSRAAEADAGAKQLAAGPQWLRETEVGLELLGLNEQQIKRAMSEKRRVDMSTLVSKLTAAPPSRQQVGGTGAVAAPDDSLTN